MAIKTLGITGTVITNPLTAWTVLATIIDNLQGGDFDRDHADTSTSFCTISASEPTSPKTGELWMDTSGGEDILKRYDGADFVPISAFIQTSAPSSTVEGTLWYDTTLFIWRIYDTIDSIAGYHPVGEGYALWVNKSGVGMVVGNPVIHDGSANVRDVTLTALRQHMGVMGVSMEVIADAATGVFATMQCQDKIQVLCDNGAVDGAVAIGDALGTFSDVSTKGEVRTLGPLPGAPYVTTTKLSHGVQTGAFARALSTKDGTTHLCSARMIGQIGTGLHVYFPRKKIAQRSQLTIDGTWNELDLTSTPNSTDIRESTKHGIVAVELSINAAIGRISSTANQDAAGSYQLGPDGLEVYYKIHLQANATNEASGDFIGDEANPHSFIGMIPTKNTGPTDIGYIFEYKITEFVNVFSFFDIFTAHYIA